MHSFRLWCKAGVAELLSSRIGPEIDGSGRRHSHQIRPQTLEEGAGTLILQDRSQELQDPRGVGPGRGEVAASHCLQVELPEAEGPEAELRGLQPGLHHLQRACEDGPHGAPASSCDEVQQLGVVGHAFFRRGSQGRAGGWQGWEFSLGLGRPGRYHISLERIHTWL